MASLIEEVQTMANRMEAALDDKNSMEYYHDELKRLRKEKKELEKNIAELEEQQNKLAC
jgi:cell division protein FtsB